MHDAPMHRHQLKIEQVEPVTIRATRYYPAWVLVRVRTTDGIEGIGEGFTWSGYADTIRDHIQAIGQLITGTSPFHIQSFLSRFATPDKDRNWFAAVSAIEIALWDVLGQVAQLPIHALLGGAVRDRIPLYADHGVFGNAQNWEVCIERILQMKEAGFGMFKWDPFSGSGILDAAELAEQVGKVEQVRDAVGAAYPLAIDAHNRFNVAGAIMAAKALEPLNILFFEAPTEDDPEQLKQVADATSIPLATGELTCTRMEAHALLASGTIGVWQPEVGTNGGILESVKTAVLAEAHGVSVATHNWCGPVVTRAASHVCAVVPNLLYQEYAGGAPENEWENALLEPAPVIEDGHLIVPQLPGLGFRLNESLIAQRRLDEP